MNTEDFRGEIISALDGSAADRLADRVESHDGPVLSHRNGQVLRGIATGIDEKDEPFFTDEELREVFPLFR